MIKTISRLLPEVLGSFWIDTLSFIVGMTLSEYRTNSRTSWWLGFAFHISLFNFTMLKSWRLWGTSLVRQSRSILLRKERTGGSLLELQLKLI
ncbi:hypothetical protein LINPERHAP1_LOCUS30590 [Linum perenne]